MKKLTHFFILILSFTIISCSDDDNTPQPTQDIVELAIENGFTSLAEALTQVDLVSTLQGDGPFTVFAPSNEAFDALLSVVGQKQISDIPNDVLTKVLLNHVVSANVKSTDVVDGNVTTVGGGVINLAVGTDGSISVSGANVVGNFDITGTNGIIHGVDAVIVPADVAQFVNTVLEPAYFSKNFTTLISAAVKADVVTTLLNTPNLTIFAPTNDAFTNSGIDPEMIDPTTLASVLTYHVVGVKVLSSGIPADAATVNGQDIFFSLVDAGNFINGNSEIITVDIESGSGVVHVIDKVLLPSSGTLVDVVSDLAGDGQFTSLLAALQRTANEGTEAQNLVNVLSGNGPFTVFAPTDAAFTALLDSNNDWNSLNDIPLETLISVLTYHVVSARAYDKDLPNAINASNEIATVQGTNLSFDLSSLTINTNSNITGVNTNATNGVIHVIDAVLIP